MLFQACAGVEGQHSQGAQGAEAGVEACMQAACRLHSQVPVSSLRCYLSLLSLLSSTAGQLVCLRRQRAVGTSVLCLDR